MNQKEAKYRLVPIKNGTVLDHLPPKSALLILETLNLDVDTPITLAINTESERLGKKDLIFIEGKLLSEKDIEKIGLIAENSTWNNIKEGKVTLKQKIPYPLTARGTIICQNPKCVTNNEPLETKFKINKQNHTAQCNYCNNELNQGEIIKAIGKK